MTTARCGSLGWTGCGWRILAIRFRGEMVHKIWSTRSKQPPDSSHRPFRHATRSYWAGPRIPSRSIPDPQDCEGADDGHRAPGRERGREPAMTETQRESWPRPGQPGKTINGLIRDYLVLRRRRLPGPDAHWRLTRPGSHRERQVDDGLRGRDGFSRVARGAAVPSAENRRGREGLGPVTVCPRLRRHAGARTALPAPAVAGGAIKCRIKSRGDYRIMGSGQRLSAPVGSA
jgi:hypothetical protein